MGAIILSSMEVAATQTDDAFDHGPHTDLSQQEEIQVTDIYSVLANKDCFQIFCLASEGIHASTKILREYKFSKKRYYVRLKQLIRTKLVLKEGRFYRHTALGKTIYESQVRQLELLLSGSYKSF